MTENTTPEMLTLSPDEFTARFAPAQSPENGRADNASEAFGSYYIHNRETGKLEMHFDKADYDALTDQQKAAIKSNFLWGRKTGCWISRCKEPNLFHARRLAESLGLADGGKTGERLSFAEQQQRKAERAEARADRLDHAADNAEQRAEQLQKPIRDMHGDVSFFTQPNINSSAGRAFTRRREKMFAAFERGFDEYRRSEHFRERAEIARRTADQAQLKDKGFIMRRIRECESAIRKLQKAVESNDEIRRKLEAGTPLKRFNGAPITLADVDAWQEADLDRLEAQLDKLGYYQDALDALGGVTFSQENIRPGFVVKMKRWGDCRVVSTGPKNFTYQTRHDGIALTGAYAEIECIISAQEKPNVPHPFKVGDTFTCHRWNPATHKTDELTFRIIRTTDKSVTLQTGDEKPFVRKPTQIAWDHSGKWRLCITDWNDGIVYKLPEA